MNLSVHLEDGLAKELARIVKRSKTNRNALINEAVRRFVAQQRRSAWPEELLEASPVEDLVPFETLRQTKSVRPRFP